jgi:hypothetical protein
MPPPHAVGKRLTRIEEIFWMLEARCDFPCSYCSYTMDGTRAALARAQARTAGSVVDPSGTTLERTLVASGDGYRRFVEGPGAPIVLREDLVGALAGREDRREPLATIAFG